MKLLALTIAAVAAVLASAAGVSIYTWGYRAGTPESGYEGYGGVIREWFALSRVQVKKVKHLAGPYYALRYVSPTTGKQRCILVDVSKTYKGSGSTFDRFWISSGLPGPRETFICDF